MKVKFVFWEFELNISAVLTIVDKTDSMKLVLDISVFVYMSNDASFLQKAL